MMKKFGVVVHQNDNSAVLRIARSTSCGGNCNKCGSHCAEQSKIEINIENKLGAEIGDYVEVESTSKRILGTAFLVYIIPVLTLILGMLLSNKIFNTSNELIALLFGLVMMFIAFIGIHLYDRYSQKQPIFTMTKVIKGQK
ncbi:MAG: SoxR reducing system RseC family protein [Clostridia bacterium]|nr:SoxR reducing system RseC family protein [Clostridia bacterium]